MKQIVHNSNQTFKRIDEDIKSMTTTGKGNKKRGVVVPENIPAL